MWLVRLGCRRRPPYRVLAAGSRLPRLANYSVGDNSGEKSDVIDELPPKITLEYGNSMHMFVRKQNAATIMDSSTSQTPETEDELEATGEGLKVMRMNL